jgi:ATP-dependent DNA helicase RecG
MSLSWVLKQTEGQFFERKSCYDRSTGVPKRRPAKDVASDVAETLSAMANADGGTLVLGIEDDGITISGVDYPPDRLEVYSMPPRTAFDHPSESA